MDRSSRFSQNDQFFYRTSFYRVSGSIAVVLYSRKISPDAVPEIRRAPTIYEDRFGRRKSVFESRGVVKHGAEARSSLELRFCHSILLNVDLISFNYCRYSIINNRFHISSDTSQLLAIIKWKSICIERYWMPKSELYFGSGLKFHKNQTFTLDSSWRTEPSLKIEGSWVGFWFINFFQPYT